MFHPRRTSIRMNIWQDEQCQIFRADGSLRGTHGGNVSMPPAPSSWEAYARGIGLELQRCRLERNMTQEELAYAAGLSRTHYQQLERGWWSPGLASNPSVKVLVALALALGVSPARLLPPVEALHLPLA